jgi:hypothetical protein
MDPRSLIRDSDEDTLRFITRDRVAPSTARRFEGKGLEPFQTWLEGRGMDDRVDLDPLLRFRSSGDEIPHSLAAQFLALYAHDVRQESGKCPDTALQALRHDFIAHGRCALVFQSDLLKEAVKRTFRWEAKEVAAAKLAREKQGFTIDMISRAALRLFPQDFGLRLPPSRCLWPSSLAPL